MFILEYIIRNVININSHSHPAGIKVVPSVEPLYIVLASCCMFPVEGDGIASTDFLVIILWSHVFSPHDNMRDESWS